MLNTTNSCNCYNNRLFNYSLCNRQWKNYSKYQWQPK